MLKKFSKRTLSILLTLCMVLGLVPMMASAAALTYAELVTGLTEFAYEDMTGETVQPSTDTANVSGLRNKSTVIDFTSGNHLDPAPTRGTTEVATEADAEDTSETRLKMTGQGTGSDGVYSSFDFRSLYSGVGVSSGTATSTSSNQGGVHLWEVKVKIPASSTGELRLFHYGYSWYANVTTSVNTTAISVKNGGVYRIEEGYVAEDAYTDYFEQYTDCIVNEGTLTAGAWYTFVRAMDLRDDMAHYDRIFVFDASGNLVSAENTWRNAGFISNASYRNGKGNLGIGFSGKNFAAGEDVYFDDIRIWNAAVPTSSAVVKADASATERFAALETDATTMRYMGVTKYLRRDSYNLYEVDVYLPSVGGDSEIVELFSLNPVTNAYFDYKYNSFAIKGGKVYTSYYDTTNSAKVETVMTATAGGELTLEAEKWYRFTYDINLTTNAFTATVKDVAADTVVGTATGTRTDTVTLATDTWPNTRFSVIGAAGYSAPIYFDNIVVKNTKDAEHTSYSTESYQSQTVNFNSGAFGSAARLQIATVPNISSLTSVAKDDVCYVTAWEDYLNVGKPLTSNDPLPIQITFSEVDSTLFNQSNVTLTTAIGEAVPTSAYTVAWDDTNAVGTITFTEDALSFDTTYVLTVANQVALAPLSVRHLDTSYTFTIAPLLPVAEVAFLNASDQEVDTLTGQTSLKAKLTYEVTAGETGMGALLILAYYGEGNTLLGVATKEGTLNGSGTLETDTALAVPAGAVRAEIMVWDGWTNLMPLIEMGEPLE